MEQLLLSGLNLELNIEQDEYIGAFTEEAGVRIDISNQGEMSFPREKGLSAAPGFATSIGIRKVGNSHLNCNQVLLYRLSQRICKEGSFSGKTRSTSFRPRLPGGWCAHLSSVPTAQVVGVWLGHCVMFLEKGTLLYLCFHQRV